MHVLTRRVQLHDIQDVEAFVNRTINRANLSLGRDERDELVCEGIAILYRLAAIYQPRREGHARDDGRFSGFAAQFLPRKLGDAWHRMHPEHKLTTDPDTGKRRWVYYDKPVSFDSVVTDHIAGDGGTAGNGNRRITEAEVRVRFEDFSPIAVPDRARARHAGPAEAGLAEAA